MDNKSRYRIIHQQVFDPFGEESHSYFYIEKLHKFLWFSFWKEVWHTGYTWEEGVDTRMRFSSIEAAEAFIRKDVPKNGIKKTIVKEI